MFKSVVARTTRVMVAIFLAGAAVAVSFPAPKASAETYGPYWIVNKNSTRCMTVRGGSTANGTVIDQYTCVSPKQNNQRFYLYTTSEELVYELRPASNTSKCVTIKDNSTSNGGLAILQTCQGTANQRFRSVLRQIIPGYDFRWLVAKHSGKCLQVNGASWGNDALISQWTCDDRSHFWWYFVRAD